MRLIQLVLTCALLVGFAAAHAAEPYRIGDWSVQANSANTNMTATTINESGNEFGRICYFDTKSCFWALLSQNSCEKDVITPVLINTASGARQLTVKCQRSEKSRSVLMFTTHTELKEVSNTDPHLGIAFPLESGRFLVMRFSLSGSDQAVNSMETAVAQREASTRDIVL